MCLRCNPASAPGTPPADWGDPVASLTAARGLSRHGLLTGTYTTGPGAGILSGLGRAAGPLAGIPQHGRGQWVVGDHHVHSIFSHDAKYLMRTQVEKAHAFGLDWLVFTEHSNYAHHAKGALDQKAELAHLRRQYPDLMLFQGLEWSIPAAGQACVVVAPGDNDAELLRAFEKLWDGRLNGWLEPTPGSPQVVQCEERARQALRWLEGERRRRVVDDALVLVSHPMRLGLNSPHELRSWRDAAPDLVVGMEGAPGAQAGAFGTFGHPRYQRGEYEHSPTPHSWPDYPADAYRTRGGYDWATSVVGGLWDSMLAEGLPFWITTNSDHHLEAHDSTTVGPYPPGQTFDTLGRRPLPVPTQTPQHGSDYWPGKFSRNHTLITRRSPRGVMAGLRAGRSWVDHGHLVSDVVVVVRGRRTRRGKGPGRHRAETLGGRLVVRRGSTVELSVTITPTDYRNAVEIRPRLAHVDVIRGRITGPRENRDSWRAPDTRVAEQTDVTGREGTYTLTYRFTADESFYLRLRGSDGNRGCVGPLGASIDPRGPIPHGSDPGAGNPWLDTWFYTNPVFVEVR